MNRIFLYLLLCSSVLFSKKATAQCVQPFDNCSDAFFGCVFEENYLESQTWTTAGFTSDTPPAFCGSIEVSIWYPFLATDSAMHFKATPSNCANGDGIQIAIYQSCDQGPIDCYGGIQGGGSTAAEITIPAGVLVPCTRYLILIDGFAGDQCDFTLEVNGLCPPDSVEIGIIEGVSVIDTDLDCLPNPSDPPATFSKVQIHTDNYDIIRPVNALGQFLHYYPDTGDVVLKALAPNDLWTVCPDEIVVNPDSFPDTAQVMFFYQPLVDCPKMSVELASFPFIRNCVDSWNRVKMCNFGTTPAVDARLEMVIPSDFPYSPTNLRQPDFQKGDTLVFNLGTMQPFECQEFVFWLETPCDVSLIGQARCVEARVFPDTPCVVNSNFSGAHIDLSATCVGDTIVEFRLKNTGTAPTSELLEYIIIEDEVVLRGGNFSLNPGETMLVSQPADGSTFRVEAEQEPLHPGFSTPAISVEGCGGVTPGMVTAFYLNDADEFVDIECREIRGSYDPNLKHAFPKGHGPNHEIPANTPLEYTIHFQNTGTDTAFRVKILDPLRAELDPSTFRPGVASHPCDWKIIDQNLLEIVFDPIALPDSNANEPASHGFFEFSIRQKPDLPLGTTIANHAEIIFDYNPAIITQPVWHNVGKLVVGLDEPKNQLSHWKLLGNPTRDRAVFVSEKPTGGQLRFELHDATGRLLRAADFSGQRFDFQRNGLETGVYFFKILEAGGGVSSGKIMVE